MQAERILSRSICDKKSIKYRSQFPENNTDNGFIMKLKMRYRVQALTLNSILVRASLNLNSKILLLLRSRINFIFFRRKPAKLGAKFPINFAADA